MAVLDLPGDERITHSWNGTHTQSGAQVTATTAAWNGDLATGGTVSFGFNATSGARPAVPSTFTLDDVVRTGSATPTTTTSSTPQDRPMVENAFAVAREGAYGDNRFTVFRPSSRSANGLPSGSPVPSLPTDAITWAEREQARSASPLAQRLDLTKVVTAGHPCGGLEALVAAQDRRVSAVVSLNSGFISGSRMTDGMTTVVQFLDMVLNGNAVARSYILHPSGLAAKSPWTVAKKNF